ncbi:YdcF family protein [Cytobacillus spongiae]|uniref:YdcF family protein n=1 Tax=Cytobacillus spongiae TaxID=2901381 RepID=UPI001F329BE0|nr:YdcF family protein [Cytobacillus spongiae]UII57927.1 YdcF family protein [Cytobacillus spongiae]
MIIITLFISLLAYIAFAHLHIIETAKKATPKNLPYLIVLGAKVNGEEMSLSLLYRAETALTYLTDNPSTKVVVTGGKGPGEDITEAEALNRFFREKGIDESRILIEDQSTSTYENMKFTKDLFEIEEAVIVSNDFHLYRAISLADNIGIKGYPLAAETPSAVKAYNYLREYLAVLKMYILGT